MREEERIRKDFRKYRREHPLPRPVIMNRKHFGDVVNEVFIPEWAGKGLEHYVKVVQLIRRNGPAGRPEEWLRFGYYRKRKQDKSFRWISRTGLVIEKSDWRRLMRDAKRRDFW